MEFQLICNKIFYFFMGFISHLVAIVAFLISVVYRFVVHSVLLKFYVNKYRLIEAGITTIMAGETKGPVNVLYVLKCKGAPPNVDAIVDKLNQAVNYETKVISGGESETYYRPFEKLRYVIVPKFGVFCWKIDHNFRAANHVVLDKVQENLDQMIQDRSEKLLDTFYGGDQPQWDVHILSREESMEYAIVWSVHHTYADANIFTQVIRYILADSPFPMKVEPLEWNRKSPSSYRKIKSYVETLLLCTLGSGFCAAVYGQCLGQTHVKENSLTETRGRTHCRAVTFNLNDFKTIQRKFSKYTPIRLTSLLFACVAPAFDRAISSSKFEKPSTVLASTVEGDYPYDSLELCIKVNTLWFDLPLKIKPLQERIYVIDKNIKNITGHLGMSLFKIGTAMIGAVISPIARILEESGSLTHTTYISNIVGPQESFTIFGGDLVTSMYVYSPISLEEVVTFVAYTYDADVTFAMVTPDRVIQKLPALLDDIVAGIKDEVGNYMEFTKAN